MKKLIADSNVYPWIIVFVVLILLLSLGNAFGQGLLEKGTGTTPTTNSTAGGYSELQPATPGTTSTTTPSFTTNLLNTLRNPKVLGLIVVMLIGGFCLLFLTKSYTKLS